MRHHGLTSMCPDTAGHSIRVEWGAGRDGRGSNRVFGSGREVNLVGRGSLAHVDNARPRPGS